MSTIHRPSDEEKKIGDRVYSCYHNGDWYWGTVMDKFKKNRKLYYSIEYDDGDFIEKFDPQSGIATEADNRAGMIPPDSQQMIESIKAEKEDALQTVSSLEQQLQLSGEQFQQVCTEKESMVTDLESRLAASNQEITVISAEKEEAQQTIATLEQKMFSADEQMNQLQSDSESSAAKHEAAYKELEGHLATVQKQFESICAEKKSVAAELEGAITDSNEKIESLIIENVGLEASRQYWISKFRILNTKAEKTT